VKTFYRISSIILILIACSVVGIFYIYTTQNIESTYAAETSHTVYTIKQDFIRDTVRNQIQRIESERNSSIEQYEKHLDSTSNLFENVYHNSTEEEFIQFYKNHFNLRTERDFWQAALWYADTGQILFDSGLLSTADIPYDQYLLEREDTYATSALKQFGNIQMFYGVPLESIDRMIKQKVAGSIHQSEFAEDTYIWVNEVVNYEGGDNYAIRRIHPNLKDTEGMYLSTNMTDIAGNFPYLEELEGIKENGELFFTYFFKRKNTDEIAKKLTYAQLYKEYDWIVAMGIHVDDMDSYVQQANEQSRKVTQSLLPLFVGMLVLLVAGSFLSLIFLERIRSRRDKRLLEEESSRDILTRALTRRIGEKDFNKSFYEYQKDQANNPAIMLFDIDNFKTINDDFGHSTGDQILFEVVQSIANYIRVTDRIYRWGGDEFIILCDGVRPENSFAFADSMREVVTSSVQIASAKLTRKVTISLGVAYFHTEDKTFQDAIARADAALYAAKRTGKNRVELS